MRPTASSRTTPTPKTTLTVVSLSDADPAKPGNQTALGATVGVVNGQVSYDPTGSARLQALGAGQSAADSFTNTLRGCARRAGPGRGGCA